MLKNLGHSDLPLFSTTRVYDFTMLTSDKSKNPWNRNNAKNCISNIVFWIWIYNQICFYLKS